MSDQSSALSIVARSEPNGVVLELAGEVDLYTVVAFRDEFIAAIDRETPCVVIDLSDVTFLDSTGLAVMVAGFKRAREHDQDVRVAGARPTVHKVFEITGLTEVFKFFGTAAEAIITG